MKYTTIQNIAILVVSLILGLIGAMQYKTIAQTGTQEQDYNPFREILLLVENNRETEERIFETEEKLRNLKTKEQITNNARDQINENKEFAGLANTEDRFLEIVVDSSTVTDITRLTNLFYQAGASNVSLNGIFFSADSPGVDSLGGQIVLGSTPLSEPYLFEVYGNTDTLLQILHPEKGALSKFSDLKFSVTKREK